MKNCKRPEVPLTASYGTIAPPTGLGPRDCLAALFLFLLFIVVFIFTTMNLYSTFNGYGNAQFDRRLNTNISECKEWPRTRKDLFFPGYKVGCALEGFLGEEL